MKPMEFTDTNFQQEVLNSETPVLVDFWAVWCGPCMAVAPVVDEIAKEYDGKLKVGKVDVDRNPNVQSRFGVRSVPTLMVFKGGKVVEQIIGSVPKRNVMDVVKPHLTVN